MLLVTRENGRITCSNDEFRTGSKGDVSVGLEIVWLVDEFVSNS